MSPEPQPALAEALLALADDELILAHRDSEWTGHAPILEEDIAFANIALDEMGHAALWYRLVAAQRGEDPERTTDRLIFHRSPADFRCVRLVELPKGDWALTIVRQYLFDAAEQVRLPALADHPTASVAQTAAKILVEERYHDRHVRAWVRRLAQGTAESHDRMQAALDRLWEPSRQLFQAMADELELVQDGLWPVSTTLGARWRAEASSFLAECGLSLPPEASLDTADRRVHSEHLEPLLAEMQSVARLAPEAKW